MRLPWPKTRTIDTGPPLHEFMLPQVLPRLDDDLRAVLDRGRWPSPFFFALDGRRRQLFVEPGRAAPLDADTHLFTGDESKRQNHALSMLRRVRHGEVFVDFAEAREVPAEVSFGRPMQVFQYHRRVGDRFAVLWRYPGYYAPSAHLGGTRGRAPHDERRFRDKRPTVFWRGGMNGSRWVSPDRREQLAPGPEDSALVSASRHFSRAAAVRLSSASPDWLDARFTDLDQPPTCDDPFWDRPTPRSVFLRHRYILCPNGHDVSSALYWVIATRSLALRETCHYEVIPDFFLQPWVHYVPVAAGLSDLEEKFAWCEAHPDACRRMLDAANDAYRRIRNPALWRVAEDTVLERLGLLT